MAGLKTINWCVWADLGLVEEINRKVLHPKGLAMSYEPDTGISRGALVSPDGLFEFHPDMKSKIIEDLDLIEILKGVREGLYPEIKETDEE